MEHRPRVYAEHLNHSLFRRPGWYWRLHCDCGFTSPYGLLLTWPVALKFANTHAWAARRYEARIDAQVEAFRQQLDARG
ncbi:hypothetical protein C8E95_6790 [Pseudonocardia autotrophica]|uniref:Uncharacterized protein n=2 Tax=Pseudonocardia TaxID=1847 RepID=A0A1Y2N678_PSEAH|nr:hypothetical protein BG845_01208 [Pseudonocardia autotrophica]TDN77542.1 hypothetical protein C8E95_6790 [Pseudonocardia autotrophica]BBG01570.1 hypothetical protein Pdca_27790 [Pseudonocardia autotrophica]GEC29081.1 hypothetical protein PSA01_61100 [Pseudonocardia saturnea]